MTTAPPTIATVEIIDIIAACAYNTQLTYDYLYQKVRKLPASGFKDFMITYVDNQITINNKLVRRIKDDDVRRDLKQDLKSTDIAFYGAICEFAREAKNLEYLAELMEVGKDVEDFEPIITQLKAIMFNHIEKSKVQ